MAKPDDRLGPQLKAADDMEKGAELARSMANAIVRAPGNKKTGAALEKLRNRSDAPATFAKGYLQAAFSEAGLTLKKVAEVLGGIIDGQMNAQPKDRLGAIKLALQAANIIGASGDSNVSKGGLDLGTLGDDELIEIVQTVRKRKTPPPVDADYKVLNGDDASSS